MYLNIYNLCQILCWCTSGSNYDVKVFLKTMPQAWHTITSQSPSGWMGSVSAWPFSDLYGIKSGIWLGHSRTFTELSWSHSSFDILLSCPTERWTVGPSLRSRVLWSRFASGMSLDIVAVIFPAILTSLPVVLPPPWFTELAWCFALPGFPKTWCLAHTKEFNRFLIRTENFPSQGLTVLRLPFGKLQAGYHVLFTNEWLPPSHSTIQAWYLGTFWEVLLCLAEWPQSSWSPPQNKALLPWSFSSDGRLALGRAGEAEFSESFGSLN